LLFYEQSISLFVQDSSAEIQPVNTELNFIHCSTLINLWIYNHG